MKLATSILICALTALNGPGRAQEIPTVDGFVTRSVSNNDFDVNGFHVQCGAATQSITVGPSATGLLNQGCPAAPPFVGEHLKIYGSKNKKAQAVKADRIEILLSNSGAVDGSAVIDTLFPGTLSSGELLLRADGRRMQVTGKSDIQWNAPLQTLADIKAGDWIEYKGKQDEQGTVVLSAAKLARASVGKGEEKLRTKNEFDPSTVPPSAKQGRASLAFTGIDPKRFPPYIDVAMQARIDEIGNKLIPAYQRALPESDPAKINFRFQLIDTTWFRDALTLPSGIILVPHQVIERLQNDSQVATVLADNIATAIERQTYRSIPAGRALLAGEVGAAAVGAVVPGAFVVPSILQVGGGQTIRVKAEEQSGRVSLGLLHDAGYDLDQAPLAWWLLAPKNPQPIAEISLPFRAEYLYRVLGESWHYTRDHQIKP